MDYFEIALKCGQDPDLIDSIRLGETHPVMAAFGLWDDREFECLTDEIYVNRANMSLRPAIEF